MDIKNVTGFEKPLVKLIETASEGLGVLGNHYFEFDVSKIKRVGEAEAEKERIKIIKQAEGQVEALNVLDRAGKRFALEQYNKQINLENILIKTRDELKGREVSDQPVERDWTMRFMDVAQNVSKKEMQDLLSKILAGEIQEPGVYSYQTLEVVKYLSSSDLEAFCRFAAISTDLGIIKFNDGNREFLNKYGLSFAEYLSLSSLGLFSQSSSLQMNVDILPDMRYEIEIGTTPFILSHKGKESRLFKYGLFVLTEAGRAIRDTVLDIAENSYKEKYIIALKEDVGKKKFDLIE